MRDNIAGTVHTLTFTGTYSVNSDCTGSATLTLSNGGTATGIFTIVDGGNELELLSLGETVVESGTFKKQ